MLQQPPGFQALSPTLALISQRVAQAVDQALVAQKVPTHHIFSIDCSGSMYGELAKIRQQLKNKLPSLVKVEDVVTIIWFSGKGQFGVLAEGLEITSAQGLANLQQAVDRYLQPMGLTGFKEPLETVQQVISRVSTATKITAHSLLFLTDGHDNQWSTAQLLEAVKPLGASLAHAVFVEYGFYCNRSLLLQLAEACGGRSIFSEAFADYAPQFEQFVTTKQTGKPKLEVTLAGTPKHGIAFSLDAEGVTTYAVEDNKTLLVDPLVDVLYYLSETPLGVATTQDVTARFAALYVLSQRMKSADVYASLYALGDTELLADYTNAFGKQKLYAFQQKALETVLGQRPAFAGGVDHDYAPDTEAYCLLDMLVDLVGSEENSFLSEHPAFVYQRIGAKKVLAASPEEVAIQAELGEATQAYSALLAENKSSNHAALGKANERVAELSQRLLALGGRALKFTPTPNPAGTPLSELVWNENRPNLSVRVFQQGTVDLSSAPGNTFGLKTFPTSQYRTYTLLKDGIVNVRLLPVRLSEDAFNVLRQKAPQVLLTEDGKTQATVYGAQQAYLLDLTALPLINRSMVVEPSVVELFTLQYKLQLAQAEQTVFNYYQKLHFPKESTNLVSQYGKEATDWLKDLGLTDAGYAPRTTEEKSGETYLSTELQVELVGMKTKAPLKDVLAKLAADNPKPLTDAQRLYERPLRLYREFTGAEFYQEAENQNILLSAWLLSKQKNVVTRVRGLLNELARLKFGVILGQVWFKEFSSLEDNTLTLDVEDTTAAGKPVVTTITGKALLKDVVVAI